LQDISRRALSAGFAREQDDARGAEHRNKESTATVPSYRTMRYGAATDFLASSSVHSNLSCACYGACSTQSANCFSMVDPPVRSWASLLFEHSVWVSRQSKFSNDQIENATRCVQTAAELTRYRIKDTAVAALPYVNQFTSAETFFLPVCRLLALLGHTDRH